MGGTNVGMYIDTGFMSNKQGYTKLSQPDPASFLLAAFRSTFGQLITYVILDKGKDHAVSCCMQCFRRQLYMGLARSDQPENGSRLTVNPCGGILLAVNGCPPSGDRHICNGPTSKASLSSGN